MEQAALDDIRKTPSPGRAESRSNREALLIAGLAAFGTRGLDGASTRDIAQTAGAPMSAITYHFGGKEGLYLACARHIADTLGGLIAPGFDAGGEAAAAGMSRAVARANLETLFCRLCRAILRDETAVFAQFIMREQTEPTAAFAILYGGVMGDVIARITDLLMIVSSGSLTILEARIRGMALMGQVIAFRAARAAVLRTTGWAAVGPAEVRAIESVILDHLDAVCGRLESESRA